MNFSGASAFLFWCKSEGNLLISMNCSTYRWAMLATWGTAQALTPILSLHLPGFDLLQIHVREKASLQNKGPGLSRDTPVPRGIIGPWPQLLPLRYPKYVEKRSCSSQAEAGSTVPLAVGPCLALTCPLCTALLSHTIWPALPFTLLHLLHLPQHAGKRANIPVKLAW